MASVESIMEKRTAEKNIRMSGKYVMTKDEWIARGGVYRESIGAANKSGYFTVRQCANMQKPVRPDEMYEPRDFAVMKLHGGHYLTDGDGRRRCPCIPVFYRGMNSTLKLRIDGNRKLCHASGDGWYCMTKKELKYKQTRLRRALEQILDLAQPYFEVGAIGDPDDEDKFTIVRLGAIAGAALYRDSDHEE